MATFNRPDLEGKLVAAVGPACLRIRNAIRAFDRDMAVPQLQAELQQQKNRINEQQDRLEQQQDIINKLVVYSMSFYIFGLLSEVYHRTATAGEYLFEKSFEGPLRYLRDHGYVEWLAIGSLRDKQNLIGLVKRHR